MNTLQLTEKERECLVNALIIFEVDKATTKEGRKLAKLILNKLGVF